MPFSVTTDVKRRKLSLEDKIILTFMQRKKHDVREWGVFMWLGLQNLVTT
jgi:hypothetical protein